MPTRLALALALLVGSGCSLLFDGADLHGKGGGSDGGVADLAMPSGTDDLAQVSGDLATGPKVLSFSAPMTFPAGDGVYDVAFGDFDQDGKIDLASSNNGGNDVSILWGMGALAFSPPMHLPTALGTFAIATADVDKNGKLDILVTAFDSTAPATNKVSVLLNLGARAFAPHVDYDTDSKPQALFLGDVNNDGNLDVVTADSAATNPGSIDVLKGTGTGTFGLRTGYNACSPTVCTTNAGGTQPYALVLGDFNGDNFLDVAAANNVSWDVAVMLNDKTGAFPQAKVTNNATAARGPSWVTVADLDHDGKLDLVVTNGDSNSLSVFINSGSGFGSPVNYDVPADAMARVRGPGVTAVGDFDGDGINDIAVASTVFNAMGFNTSDVTIYLGKAGGTFATTPIPFPCGPMLSVPSGMQVGDLNGDGKPDLLLGNYISMSPSSSTVTILVNTSN